MLFIKTNKENKIVKQIVAESFCDAEEYLSPNYDEGENILIQNDKGDCVLITPVMRKLEYLRKESTQMIPNIAGKFKGLALTDLKQIIGKTVKYVYETSDIEAIRFEDDTYIIYGAVSGEYDEGVSIEIQEANINILTELGYITPKEKEQYYTEKREHEALQRQVHDRDEYERLKRRFGQELS